MEAQYQFLCGVFALCSIVLPAICIRRFAEKRDEFAVVGLSCGPWSHVLVCLVHRDGEEWLDNAAAKSAFCLCVL